MFDVGCKFSDLLGKTLLSAEQTARDEIVFTTTENETYRLYHQQDCCESVEIEDICGDLADLIGSPIVEAEEASNGTDPKKPNTNEKYESWTWTFYKLRTAKGSVTIRWYGESNGYYSERVDFEQVVN